MIDRDSGTNDSSIFRELILELYGFIERNGPEEHEYVQISALFDQLYEFRVPHSAQVVAEFAASSRGAFNTTETNQGFGFLRPHGYHGDFEIIDRIYNMWTSSDPSLVRWDHYFHWTSAARAVRARKDYCIRLFESAVAAKNGLVRILNVASGPGRDVFEFFRNAPNGGTSSVSVHCIDQDANAIKHAKSLLEPYCNQVTFENRNVFRARLKNNYDLVWSAGLFDYLEDNIFIRLLSKLSLALSPGGELVVGNFSNRNIHRSYMEFGGWQLIHRDRDDLMALAKAAKISNSSVRIDQEPNGINLFMRIKKDS